MSLCRQEIVVYEKRQNICWRLCRNQYVVLADVYVSLHTQRQSQRQCDYKCTLHLNQLLSYCFLLSPGEDQCVPLSMVEVLVQKLKWSLNECRRFVNNHLFSYMVWVSAVIHIGEQKQKSLATHWEEWPGDRDGGSVSLSWQEIYYTRFINSGWTISSSPLTNTLPLATDVRRKNQRLK